MVGQTPPSRTPPVQDDLETHKPPPALQPLEVDLTPSTPFEPMPKCQAVDLAFRLARTAVAAAVFPAQDPVFSWQMTTQTG